MLDRLMTQQERDLAELRRENDWLRQENGHLRAVLVATQRALREMQAQRDKAREGKR